MVEQLTFQLGDGGSIPTSPLQLFVKPISKLTAGIAYNRWHYLKDKGFIQTHGFGAFYDSYLVGALSFHQVSAVETVKGLFGSTGQLGVFEIGRLAMSDDCPKNSESRFIRISIMLLSRMAEVRAVISYADSGVGHTGIIYKAAGFRYLGLTAQKSDFWVNGKIQERGKTKGVKGIWVPRSRKHMFIKIFKGDVNEASEKNIGLVLGSKHESPFGA